jgi:hypothetical protein
MQIYLEVGGVIEPIDVRALLGAGIMILSVYLAFYFFMSIAFYRMAKKQNVKRPFLAFIPFVRYLTAGKVIGNGVLFGKKSNKIGLVAMLATLFIYGTFVIYQVLTYVAMYQAVANGYNVVLSLSSGIFIEKVVPQSVEALSHTLTDFIRGGSNAYYVVMVVLQFIQYFADFIQIIFMWCFWNNLFTKYKPGMSLVYTIIATLSPILLGPFIEVGAIFAFVFRNRDQFDIEEYIKTMQARAHNQAQNGNPYNGYQGQNPYGNPYQNTQNNTNSNDDPFEEFSNKNGKNDDPFGM